MRLASTLLLLCLFVGASHAASPEDAYLAARDKYVAQFKAMEKAKVNSDKIDAAHTKAIADLEEKLRGIVGEVSVKGVPSTGKINLESLTDAEVGYGMLDGMKYFDEKEDSPQLVVTTRYLLDKWLAAAAKDKDKSRRIAAELARAVLGGWAQDVGPNLDYWLIVTVVKDGKVYIGSVKPKSKVGEIAVC